MTSIALSDCRKVEPSLAMRAIFDQVMAWTAQPPTYHARRGRIGTRLPQGVFWFELPTAERKLAYFEAELARWERNEDTWFAPYHRRYYEAALFSLSVAVDTLRGAS